MKPTMRILFVDQTAQLGGAELCLKDLVLARRAQDRVFLFQDGPLATILRSENVDVVTQAMGGGAEGIRKESGLWKKLAAPKAVFQLSRAVAKSATDTDVLYANTPKALVVAAIASWMSRRPLIYHLHDILSREHFSRSNLWLLVWLSNRTAAHVIANSESTKQAYVAAGGRAPTTVVYNGFDAGEFERYFADRLQARELRREQQLNESDIVIGVFGRFAPWKGQHVAIEAIKELENVHLWLVGEALFGEQDYQCELERAASEVSVAGRVHFLGFRSDVGPLMQATDIVVHCSTAPEPFGRVIVEAMLSRRPLVASCAGGAAEIIDDGRTGLLAEPGNAAHLTNRLREILADPTANAERVTQAFSTASKRFELQAIVAEIENIVCAAANRAAI